MMQLLPAVSLLSGDALAESAPQVHEQHLGVSHNKPQLLRDSSSSAATWSNKQQ